MTEYTKTRPLARTGRLALLGALLLLLVIFLSGCPSGPTLSPITTPDALKDLGAEMTAMEKLNATQISTLQSDTVTPAQIELVEHLSAAQLGTFDKLTSADIEDIPLGYETAVIAKLLNQPEAMAFVTHLTADQKKQLRKLTRNQLDALDQKKPDALAAFTKDAGIKTARMDVKTRQSYDVFWQGYLTETAAKVADDDSLYTTAKDEFYSKSDGPYAAQARYRLGILGLRNKLGADSNKVALTNFQMLARYRKTFPSYQPEILLWVRKPELAAEDGPAVIGDATTPPPAMYTEMAPTVATLALDEIYRTGGGWDQVYHGVVKTYISFFKGIFHGYGTAIALIFLALLIKLVTIPMTTASYRGIRDMQRIQPLIKELQEKYKDDKAKQAEEQMKLMKEHKVNPAGGCLPMLIQLPIFFVVYHAVQVYAAGFADSKFLWVQNLAHPDTILLMLYAASMVLTQKLTAAPAMDAQQKMMQTQTTYLIPVVLLFVLSPLASAFVLYWFFLNVFSAVHQYYLMKKFDREEAEKGQLATVPTTPNKKGKRS